MRHFDVYGNPVEMHDFVTLGEGEHFDIYAGDRRLRIRRNKGSVYVLERGPNGWAPIYCTYDKEEKAYAN